MIWAQARGRVIGRNNDLPWHVPEDMAHFTATTKGQVVIMGRKQWESLPPKFRPLPRRENIVITRNASYQAPGAVVVSSLPEAIARAKSLIAESGELGTATETWICGGGQIYAAGMDLAEELSITEIDLDVDGDVYAPAIGDDWQQVESSPWHTSKTGPQYRFLRFRRAE